METKPLTTVQLKEAMKLAKQIESLEKQKLTALKNYNERCAELQKQIDETNQLIRSITNPDEKTETE